MPLSFLIQASSECPRLLRISSLAPGLTECLAPGFFSQPDALLLRSFEGMGKDQSEVRANCPSHLCLRRLAPTGKQSWELTLLSENCLATMPSRRSGEEGAALEGDSSRAASVS